MLSHILAGLRSDTRGDKRREQEYQRPSPGDEVTSVGCSQPCMGSSSSLERPKAHSVCSFLQGYYFCVKQYALECSRIPMGQSVNSQVMALYSWCSLWLGAALGEAVICGTE